MSNDSDEIDRIKRALRSFVGVKLTNTTVDLIIHEIFKTGSGRPDDTTNQPNPSGGKRILP